MTKNTGGPFVSLHNHTQIGSNLDGMSEVTELFERARDIDHPAIAITDHGTLTAHYDCWKASKKTGVQFIPGIEAYFTEDLSTKKNRHMILLAQNEAGYRNILRLNYESYKNQVPGYMGKYTPRISWEHIREFNEGVICLTACSSGLVARTLITEQDEERALCHIDTLNNIFKDRFYLEIQPHALYHVSKKGDIVDQTKLNETLIKFSRDLDIPFVITCDAHYKDRDHAKYHDMMLAIKDKKALDDPDRFRYGVQDMYLKTHEEIIEFFGEEVASEGMRNSIKIADLCERPTYLEPVGPILPPFPVKDEPGYPAFHQWHEKSCPKIKEDKAYLRYKCIQGFQKKMEGKPPEIKKKYWDRVKMEISVLEDKGFSSYMLMVSDYTNWAKENDIPSGPARGSSAGSVVAFLSGITTIDPIKYGLIFERFHNKAKKSFPDIDSDFSRPGEVKEYLKHKYGADRVASISNWNRMTPKSLIKDVARTLRIGGDKKTAFTISGKITDIMPDCDTVEEAVAKSDEVAAFMAKYPVLYENVKKLQNKTRNWSVHAAGVVISDRPLYELIPLRIDPETGLVVAQWEKTRCEEFGLVKFDILGVKTLAVIDEAFKTIRDAFGEKLSVEGIDLDDKSTYDLISSGKTLGVFQLEASLAPLCKRIRPNDIETIADINALGRPSCSKAERKSYIRRKFGLDKIEYRHPSLENALKKTFGVSLYEEGMMFIAQDCAGWDLNQADALRKITKNKGKDPELALKTETSFIRDCIRHSNVSYETAKNIWENEIEPFSLYGFNKCLLMSETVRIMPLKSQNNKWVDVQIKDVRPGSLIRSRDESSGEDIITSVIANHPHGKLKVFEVELDSGEKIRCTINHKFRTTEGEMLPLWQILEENKEIFVFAEKYGDKNIMNRGKDV